MMARNFISRPLTISLHINSVIAILQLLNAISAWDVHLDISCLIYIYIFKKTDWYFSDIFGSLDGIWDFLGYQEMDPKMSQKYSGISRYIGSQHFKAPKTNLGSLCLPGTWYCLPCLFGFDSCPFKIGFVGIATFYSLYLSDFLQWILEFDIAFYSQVVHWIRFSDFTFVRFAIAVWFGLPQESVWIRFLGCIFVALGLLSHSSARIPWFVGSLCFKRFLGRSCFALIL